MTFTNTSEEVFVRGILVWLLWGSRLLYFVVTPQVTTALPADRPEGRPYLSRACDDLGWLVADCGGAWLFLRRLKRLERRAPGRSGFWKSSGRTFLVTFSGIRLEGVYE
jgi:hypothetical protein